MNGRWQAKGKHGHVVQIRVNVILYLSIVPQSTVFLSLMVIFCSNCFPKKRNYIKWKASISFIYTSNRDEILALHFNWQASGRLPPNSCVLIGSTVELFNTNRPLFFVPTLVLKSALKKRNTNFCLEHSVRKNGTTFSDVPLLLLTFRWNDPKK